MMMLFLKYDENNGLVMYDRYVGIYKKGQGHKFNVYSGHLDKIEKKAMEYSMKYLKGNFPNMKNGEYFVKYLHTNTTRYKNLSLNNCFIDIKDELAIKLTYYFYINLYEASLKCIKNLKSLDHFVGYPNNTLKIKDCNIIDLLNSHGIHNLDHLSDLSISRSKLNTILNLLYGNIEHRMNNRFKNGLVNIK